MSLGQKKWQTVSVHNVVLAWLRAEREGGVKTVALARVPELVWAPGLNALLDRPQLNDPEENRARPRLLYMYRNVFMVEIPLIRLGMRCIL